MHMKTTIPKQPQQKTERLAVTVAEMAQMIGVSRPYAYEILNREDFTGDFRIGGRRLVSVDYLRKWISEQINNPV